MDESDVTYVDDEHVDNHGYDDNTDDDHDNNNDIYGHVSMIYRWYSHVIAMLEPCYSHVIGYLRDVLGMF